jgi:hypothetical protein
LKSILIRCCYYNPDQKITHQRHTSISISQETDRKKLFIQASQCPPKQSVNKLYKIGVYSLQLGDSLRFYNHYLSKSYRDTQLVFLFIIFKEDINIKQKTAYSHMKGKENQVPVIPPSDNSQLLAPFIQCIPVSFATFFFNTPHLLRM